MAELSAELKAELRWLSYRGSFLVEKVMSKKVLINVAPVAATCRHIDPQAIAADVLEYRRQGAAMVHLHVRDEHGALTSDTKLLEETLKLIREQSDIIIEVSTLCPNSSAISRGLLAQCGLYQLR